MVQIVLVWYPVICQMQTEILVLIFVGNVTSFLSWQNLHIGRNFWEGVADRNSLLMLLELSSSKEVPLNLIHVEVLIVTKTKPDNKKAKHFFIFLNAIHSESLWKR